MPRVGIVIAISTLFVSLCSAQQTATKACPNVIDRSCGTTQSVKNEHPLNLTGSGTTNYVALWTNASNLTSSVIYQTSGNVGVGTTTPVAKLDVNGNINTAATYGIGGSSVVNIGSPADVNLFLGIGAGGNNVAGTGVLNTFSSSGAGAANTTGWANSFFGSNAGNSNTTGIYNTFVGAQAGFLTTTGGRNTFVGTTAGQANTTGIRNTFLGEAAGFANTTGSENTSVGRFSGINNITGGQNLFAGVGSGSSNVSSSNNVFLGYEAGFFSTGATNTFVGNRAGISNTTGSNDVYIANAGPVSGTEGSTIRIGTQGTGVGQQNATYIAGIYGTIVTGTQVFVDNNGHLGQQTSSRRFKEQILDMGDSTSKLFQLRPVTFFYKPQYDDGSHLLQYGLIAEEVAKVYPDMVAYDKDGQPYTVKYQYLAPMLLNELQKQHTVVAAQQDVIKTQQQQIRDMQQRLSQLESLIANK